MKQSTNNNTAHYLFDPVSGEGSMAFIVQGDGTVEVSESCHPDLPEDSSLHSVEEAREIYRRAIKSGWVAVR